MGMIANPYAFLCSVKIKHKDMNCKAFFSSLLLGICVMASCCKFEMVNTPARDGDFGPCPDGFPTKVEEDSEYAFVRIGMYETIANHTLTITDMRVECDNPEVEIPQFGGNIIDSEAISSVSYQPTFDTVQGEYHRVLPSGTSGNLKIRFDALLRCNDNGFTMPIEDVTITIDASKADWKSNCSYNYILRIDARTLGLTEITFNPEVSDFEEVTING